MEVMIAEIPVSVTKKKIKNYNLRIKSDGKVCLSVPYGTRDEKIYDFLTMKENWIREHLEKINTRSKCEYRDYISGESLDIFGERYTLIIENATKCSLTLSNSTATLFCPNDSTRETRENIVRESLRALLKEKIAFYLPKWEQLTGLYSTSWRIKRMKTRWGTCNTRTGMLWFNLKLAEKSDKCINYVILHELIHLKVHDHGPRFKSLLDRHMPDWRDVQRYLNSE